MSIPKGIYCLLNVGDNTYLSDSGSFKTDQPNSYSNIQWTINKIPNKVDIYTLKNNGNFSKSFLTCIDNKISLTSTNPRYTTGSLWKISVLNGNITIQNTNNGNYLTNKFKTEPFDTLKFQQWKLQIPIPIVPSGQW